MRYEVGDRVMMRSLQWCKENIFNNEDKYPPEIFRGIEKFCGKILMISDAVDKSKYVDEGYYNMAEDTEWEYYWTDEMIECKVDEEIKPKFKVGDKITNGEITFTILTLSSDRYGAEDTFGECGSVCFKSQDEWKIVEEETKPIDLNVKGEEAKERIEIAIPEGYEYVIESDKIIFTKKKKTYPKTYEECLKIMGIKFNDCYIQGYKSPLLEDLQELLICRNAYWKIAGEEMGLGKPWEPDWKNSEMKYTISFEEDEYTPYRTFSVNCPFAFPTEEMRDEFYENFKELIEQCKELL